VTTTARWVLRRQRLGALWVKAVAFMGPDERESFQERTFKTWSRDSLGDVRRAIAQRRREFSR
jgi:hypothetical protein